MTKRILLMLSLVAALTGCASGVKLDDVAVEDKSGTPVTAQTTPGTGSGGATSSGTGGGNVGAGGVAPLDVSKQPPTGAGPSGPTIVYFDFDSFAVKPEFQPLIENQARFLKADSRRRVSIEGHTDERGGREYNLALGQKRAEAVRRSLGVLGVPDAQVEAVSFGKEKPAVTGGDDSAMARNRRAEFVYR